MPSDYLTEWEKSKDDHTEQLELFIKDTKTIHSIREFTVIELIEEIVRRLVTAGVK